MIVLLLFYPYRIMDDLVIDVSYWDKYKPVLSNNELSSKSLEVIQNIQDASHNCSNLRRAKDDLDATTLFTPHGIDNKTKRRKWKYSWCKWTTGMFKQLNDTGLENSDPNKRSLSIIGKR